MPAPEWSCKSSFTYRNLLSHSRGTGILFVVVFAYSYPPTRSNPFSSSSTDEEIFRCCFISRSHPSAHIPRYISHPPRYLLKYRAGTDRHSIYPVCTRWSPRYHSSRDPDVSPRCGDSTGHQENGPFRLIFSLFFLYASTGRRQCAWVCTGLRCKQEA